MAPTTDASHAYDRELLLAQFVSEQIAPWSEARLDRNETEHRLRFEAQRQNIWLYQITSRGVFIIEKGDPAAINSAFFSRSRYYLELLIKAYVDFVVEIDFVLAVDVDDEAEDIDELPIFSFQKLKSQKNILLPDVDVIALDYLRKVPVDRIAYADKKTAASFVGSTTGGGYLTAESVGSTPFPRLRAARYFRERSEVDFRLPNLVQCSDEARAVMLNDGFGVGAAEWDYFYDFKFAISIDGNGAACARPAMILLSKSCLVKYESDCVLFYSGGLIDGKNFISVSTDEQVINIVNTESETTNFYERVGESSRIFAQIVFNEDFCLEYTRRIISAYAKLFS